MKEDIERLTRERDKERKHVARLMRDLEYNRKRAENAEARLAALPQEPAPEPAIPLNVAIAEAEKAGFLSVEDLRRLAAPVASPLVGEDAVERYQATTPFGGDMVSNPQGQWVRFEDAMAKIAAISAASIPTGVKVTDAMVERAARSAFDTWWNDRGPGRETTWHISKNSWLAQQRAAFSAVSIPTVERRIREGSPTGDAEDAVVTAGETAPSIPTGVKVTDAMVEAAAKSLWPSVSPTWEEAYDSPLTSHNGCQVAYWLQKARKALKAAALISPSPVGGQDLPVAGDGDGAMTPEEIRLENLKQMAAYAGPIVSFETREPYYLASCDHCGWVGSSEHCGTDSFGDDSDVYCPRCHASGADCGKVATALSHPAPERVVEALQKIAEVREHRHGSGVFDYKPALTAEQAQALAFAALAKEGQKNG